ncbi:MAG: hypothetical protein RL141_157 [Candidatus Parcubacteria bacterium]|jgi:riboflavin kinase/FMN adenylyltransferase
MQPLKGIVIAGRGLARGLGYPTANIEYMSSTPPESGVWTCTVDLGGEPMPALAVIGMWPLENGCPSLEVHLLGTVQEELYGKTLSITLHAKLRDLVAFSTTEALIEQIKKDIEAARSFFGYT